MSRGAEVDNEMRAHVASKSTAKSPDGRDFEDTAADVSKNVDGISRSPPGTVSNEEKVVVCLPSDPSLRTSHPPPPRSSSHVPLPVPESAHEAAIAEGPVDSRIPRAPRVPFHDDDTEARRRRLEPTALVARKASERAIVAPKSAMIDSAAGGGPSSSKPLVVGLFVIAMVLGGMFTFLVGTRSGEHQDTAKTSVATTATTLTTASAAIRTATPTSPSAATAATAATASPSSEPAKTAATATAATATASEETVLSIDTIPTRATILIGGTKVGTSPTELKVPKSSDPLTLEIRHPGYVVLRERLVPDVNQRLKLTLTAAHTPQTRSSSVPYHKFE